MSSENKDKLIVISVPESGKLVHQDNQIIVAKLSLRNSEIDADESDFLIKDSPGWFQKSYLKALFIGRQEKYRIYSVSVFHDRLVLRVQDRAKNASTDSEITLVPSATSEVRFMLALHLVNVFECLARIELYWGMNQASKQNEFEVIRQDIDLTITVANERKLFSSLADKLLNECKAKSNESSPTKKPKSPAKPEPKTKDSKKSAETKPNSKEPKPKPQSQTEHTTKNISDKMYEDVIRALEGKKWVVDGKSTKTEWSLMDCAEYIVLIGDIVADSRSLSQCVNYLNAQFGLASGDKIREFLGDSMKECLATAREWFR